METTLFNNFYSEFIQLVSDLKYTSEMLIQKFKHKLLPWLQNQLNSGIELSMSISVLAKRCFLIYEQIQTKNRIQNRTKPTQTTLISASMRPVAVPYQLPITNTQTNSSFRVFQAPFWELWYQCLDIWIKSERAWWKKEDVLFLKREVMQYMTVLGKERLPQFQKLLIKRILIREKNISFQSQEKETFCFIIIYAKRFILHEFFYYLI